MEMERQQPSRTPEGNRPRDKDHGTRSMGQVLSREDQPQESRRRTISFSSEEPYRRWFGMEILDHGENAVNLERLNSVGVLLFNHDTDKVVGKVIGTFKTPPGGSWLDRGADGGAGNLSTAGRFTGPCQIARKWTPLEVSVVSVPADPTVGVGRADAGQTCAPLSVYERQIQANKNLIFNRR